MAPYIELVAIEAQPFTTALELFGRGQPTERPRRGWIGGPRRSQGRERLAGWCRWGACGRPNVAGRKGLLHGQRPLLEGAAIVHGRLEVLGISQLDVHADVIWKTSHEKLGPLTSRNSGRVTRQGLETIREVLHRGGEG